MIFIISPSEFLLYFTESHCVWWKSDKVKYSEVHEVLDKNKFAFVHHHSGFKTKQSRRDSNLIQGFNNIVQ